MEHKIEIRDLHYRVPTREILHDVSLQVDKNQFVGLIGPNGSGKTTLLKHIYRALPPEKSTVFINGREIEAFSYLTGEAQAGSIITTSNDNRRTYNNSVSSTIQVQQLVVRDEQDVRALAEEIAALTRRQQRGKGMRMA